MFSIRQAALLSALSILGCRSIAENDSQIQATDNSSWWKKENWKKKVPTNYNTMEIEAKWTLENKKDFATLVEFFNKNDGEKFEDYHINVRWDKKPRLFHDRYFDTADGSLERSHHTLRHRQRLKMTNDGGDAWSGKLSKVSDKKFAPEWDRIQYKSTPSRIGPVWFRNEVGECLLWNAETKLDQEDGKGEYCTGIQPSKNAAEQVLKGINEKHPAIAALLQDHGKMKQGKLLHTIDIWDYRYRVVFGKKVDKNKFEAMYEMSIDGMEVTDLKTGKTSEDYEVELEIIQDDTKYSDEVIDNLMDLSRVVEDKLFTNRLKIKFKHSDSSKSGVTIPEN